MPSLTARCRMSFNFLMSVLLILTSSVNTSTETVDVVDDFSTSVAPGLKVRVWQSGFNYAANVAVNTLSGRIQQLRIPDQKGSAKAPIGRVTYWVNNLRVAQFAKPSAKVASNPATGLTLTFSNAVASVRGNWRIKYGLIKESGWLECTVNAALMSVSAIFGSSSTGQPTIRSTGCSCVISSVTIKLHGGGSKIIDRHIHEIEGMLKNDLQTKLCREAQQAISVTATRRLAKINMRVPIGHYLTLDLGLLSAPTYSPAYVDSFHKGEFFYVGDSSEAPFQPNLLPSTAPSRMVAVWMSDYVLNTAAYVMHKHGMFNRTITRQDLPLAYQNLLSITCCSTCKCIGKLLPDAAVNRFPNASVELELATSTAPASVLNASGVMASVTGTTRLLARLVNGTLAYIMTLAIQAQSVAVPSINASVVHVKVTSLSANVSVVDSAVGPVDEKRLSFVVNFILRGEIVPKLNEMGAVGFPLRLGYHIRLVNSGLQLLQDALCIYTDVDYIGEAASGEFDYQDVQPSERNRELEEIMIIEQSQSSQRFQPLK